MNGGAAAPASDPAIRHALRPNVLARLKIERRCPRCPREDGACAETGSQGGRAVVNAAQAPRQRWRRGAGRPAQVPEASRFDDAAAGGLLYYVCRCFREMFSITQRDALV